ncbi:MAG TPA: hypothetical protein VIY86_01915, partial [Pirellulaceae bacterium]
MMRGRHESSWVGPFRGARLWVWALVAFTSVSCQSEHPLGPVTPPRATFLPRLSVIGHLHSYRQPWSPVGLKLVLQSPSSSGTALRVLDATDVNATPFEVYSGDGSRFVVWSPDGE